MDFVKRPVAVLTLTAFLAFCVLANLCFAADIYLLIVSAAVSILFLAISLWSKLKRKTVLRLRYLFLISAGFFIAFLLVFLNFSGEESELYSEREVETVCVVREIIWESDRNVCCKAQIIEADGEKTDFYAALECAEKYETGSIVSGNVYFSQLENTETFDEKQYYMSKGIVLKGDLYEDLYLGKAEKSFFDFFKNINEELSSRLESFLSKDSGALANAVVFGNKGTLSREIKRDFSKIGISHLIAISGMHISYISAAFFTVTRRLKTGRKKASFICIFIMLFYMGLTGFSASVTRAALLCCLVSLGYLFGLCHDGITAVGVCGLGMVSVCPYFAFDMGMQLSFAAYLGCLATVRIVERRKEKRLEKTGRTRKKRENIFVRFLKFVRNYICSSVLLTLTVTAFTLPIVWLYYDSTSVIAPLSNLIFIPLFSIVMYLGIGVTVLSFVPFVGGAVVFVTEKFLSFVLALSEMAASFEGITVSLRYFFSAALVVLIFIFTVAAVCTRKKTSLICSAAIVFCVLLYALGVFIHGQVNKDSILFTRIDGKNGEGIVIMYEGEAYLCDFSDGSASEAVRALNAVTSRNGEGVDTVILTDVGYGHLSLVQRICEIDYVKRVYLPKTLDLEKSMLKTQIENYLESKGIDCYTLSFSEGTGDSFPFEIISDEGGFSLFSEGETSSFLYLSSGFDDYYKPKLLLKDTENTFVLFGKSRKKTETGDLKKLRDLYDGATVNWILTFVPGEFYEYSDSGTFGDSKISKDEEKREYLKKELFEATGINIYCSSDSIGFRMDT